jgi:hypothetical protein
VIPEIPGTVSMVGRGRLRQRRNLAQTGNLTGRGTAGTPESHPWERLTHVSRDAGHMVFSAGSSGRSFRNEGSVPAAAATTATTATRAAATAAARTTTTAARGAILGFIDAQRATAH